MNRHPNRPNRPNQRRAWLLLGGILVATLGFVLFFALQLLPLARQIMVPASATAPPAVAAVPPRTPTLVPGGMAAGGAAALPLQTPTATVVTLADLLAATVPVDQTALPQGAVMAKPRAVIERELVNVRSAPSVAGELLAQRGKAQEVEILATSADGQWYKVCCPLGTQAERESWIGTEYLRLLPVMSAANEPGGTTADVRAATHGSLAAARRGVVTGSIVNIRRGPGT